MERAEREGPKDRWREEDIEGEGGEGARQGTGVNERASLQSCLYKKKNLYQLFYYYST